MTDHSQSEQEARALLYERSGGRCEICGDRATDFSHRKSRGQRGRWSVTNGLHLCRVCHGHCHANPDQAYENGWFVPSYGDPEQVRVKISTWLGVGWYKLNDWGGYDVIDLLRTPYGEL